MNIAVFDSHMDNYAEMASFTIPNKQEYCQRHGYTFLSKIITESELMPAIHPVTWDRLRLLIELLRSGRWDWIWTIGTDTMITNMTTKLESLIDEDYHFIISCEWCSPMQADSFLACYSPECLSFLDAVMSLYGQFKSHCWVEQAAMIELLPKFKDWIKILPQRAMNSYDYTKYAEMYPNEERITKANDYQGNSGQWQRGDFVIHWPGLKPWQRINFIKEILPQIVR
jgi:hypothetical protein